MMLVIVISPTIIYSQQRCASYEHLLQQMAADPVFAKKIRETEKSFDAYSSRNRNVLLQNGRAGTIIIPVVVHVVYNTPEQNISDAQVQSQIDVLNEDFTATNNDYKNYDAGYGGVKGDANIQFSLSAIVRKQTAKKSFGFNDQVKKDKMGGSSAIDPMNKFNIWVCNLGQNLLGYAQFPGGTPETFGVVCHYKAFGKGDFNLFADYNLGRTATHEIGHCLGLRHIWGDSRCGNDLVDDTPLHNDANYGCPGEGHRSTCTGKPLEMWMNYMDYTDDQCMYFFSDGQVSRMDYFIDNDTQIGSIINSSRRPGINDITATGNTTNSSVRLVKPDADLKIYPSITSGQIIVEISNAVSSMATVDVYNITGARVMKQTVFVNEDFSTTNLDVSQLMNGVYILQFNQGSTRKSKKFIIQH